MARKRFRMNRAVGIMNKGDEFTGDPEDATIASLVGAGYADPILEEGEDDGAPVRGEPGDDPNRTTPIGFQLQPADSEHDQPGGSQDRTS